MDYLAYYENWLGARRSWARLRFVPKWTSPDGLTMWMVFSVYDSAPEYHDCFNLVKATLTLRTLE